MASKIEFGTMVDGEFHPIPNWLLSRGVWLGFLLALTNAYEFVAFTDPTLLQSLFGVAIPPAWSHGINTVGNLLGIWFRINAKQPLGEAAKGGRITSDEVKALQDKLRAEQEGAK